MMADSRHVPAERSSADEVDAFLRHAAALAPVRPVGERRGRLMFAMDATASREPTWERACRIQSDMFGETAVLGGLDVQLVYYRGFRECKASPWVAKPEELLCRMASVRCQAGPTQFGRVLAHAARQTEAAKVNALVFVGDCFEEDIDAVAHQAGELGLLGVPVFVFHEGREPRARRAFETVARLTGGAYCAFDAGSAQHLRDLLSAVAVFAVGGRAALEHYGRARGGAVHLLTSQLGKPR